MCELLGLAFNASVSPGLSFRGFRHRAVGNRHGWGLAAIGGGRATIVKEPIRADRSRTAAALRDDATLTAPIFIGHVRAASRGNVDLRNTHPFHRSIAGSDFVFAHNGTLDMRSVARRGTGDQPVEGETDSELAMAVLLAWMDAEKIAITDYARIEAFLRDLNTTGDLNLLFSDGHRLLAYHDQHGYNGLCWTRRKAPFPSVALLDEDWEANLPEQKAPRQHGYVIASRPLTEGEPWTSFAHGSLMAFEGGSIVYGG